MCQRKQPMSPSQARFSFVLISYLHVAALILIPLGIFAVAYWYSPWLQNLIGYGNRSELKLKVSLVILAAALPVFALYKAALKLIHQRSRAAQREAKKNKTKNPTV